MPRAGEHVGLGADHEGALLNARLAQDELQRLQCVLEHVLWADVDLHGHIQTSNSNSELKQDELHRHQRVLDVHRHLEGQRDTDSCCISERG